MGVIIGMDEAGYGPNLGPLVITATVWDVPGCPHDVDLYEALADVIDRESSANGKIQIADSKQVYAPHKGLAALEHSVHTLLGLQEPPPAKLTQLWSRLIGGEIDVDACGPWLRDTDLDLPLCIESDTAAATSARLRNCCDEQSISLRTIVSEVVTPRAFNQLLDQYDSKGVLLSRLSMRLLSRVVDFDGGEPTLVIADKHGGRNRYDHLLEDIAGDHFIVRDAESRSFSSYRIAAARIRFQTRAEEHLPVAAASLVCKYVREAVMELFNAYWRRHLPDIKPTKGYPVDAKRFRDEIQPLQHDLGIADEMLWRAR